MAEHWKPLKDFASYTSAFEAKIDYDKDHPQERTRITKRSIFGFKRCSVYYLEVSAV